MKQINGGGIDIKPSEESEKIINQFNELPPEQQLYISLIGPGKLIALLKNLKISGTDKLISVLEESQQEIDKLSHSKSNELTLTTGSNELITSNPSEESEKIINQFNELPPEQQLYISLIGPGKLIALLKNLKISGTDKLISVLEESQQEIDKLSHSKSNELTAVTETNELTTMLILIRAIDKIVNENYIKFGEPRSVSPKERGCINVIGISIITISKIKDLIRTYFDNKKTDLIINNIVDFYNSQGYVVDRDVVYEDVECLFLRKKEKAELNN